MKIEYENKATTKFEELHWGMVFKLRNRYFMKTDSIDENGIELGANAVSLEDGILTYFVSDIDVEVVEAALKIKVEPARIEAEEVVTIK